METFIDKTIIKGTLLLVFFSGKTYNKIKKSKLVFERNVFITNEIS